MTKKQTNDVTQKMKDFGDLLASLEKLENKKKLLWKDIYENAITDRMNAYMLFTSAYTGMAQGTTEHMQLGPIMAKYIERMNKANDQLLKLADLIQREEDKQNSIDADDLFSKISE